MCQSSERAKTVVSSYSVHGLASFEVDGAGSLFDYLRYQYKLLESSAGDGALCFKDNKDKAPSYDIVETYSGVHGKYFKDHSGGFIFKYNNADVIFDGALPLFDQVQIGFDPDFNKQKASVICELFFRLALIEVDTALVHCAAVEKNGRAILFPACKGMGKTAAALKMTQAGYSFMSDDRVWLNKDAVVLSYPRYIVLKFNNIKYFKAFVGGLNILTNSLYLKVSSLFDVDRVPLIGKAFRRVFKYPSKYFYVEEIYPDVSVTDKCKAGLAVEISRAESLAENDLFNSSSEMVSTSAVGVCNLEWNLFLLELASVHDVLFSDGPSWLDELHCLMDKEADVIQKAFYLLDCYNIRVPMEDVDYEDFVHKVSCL